MFYHPLGYSQRLYNLIHKSPNPQTHEYKLRRILASSSGNHY